MLGFFLTLLETDEQKVKIEHIYKKYGRYMVYIAQRITHDPYLAEDAVHETFLNLIRIIDDVRSNNDQELKSFLRILTSHHAVDIMRKMDAAQKKDQEWEMVVDLDEKLSVEAIVLGKMNYDHMLQMIMEMDEKYKTPLTLKVQGYKINEIAEFLEITPENVKVRLYRARKLLLKEMEKTHDRRQ